MLKKMLMTVVLSSNVLVLTGAEMYDAAYKAGREAEKNNDFPAAIEAYQEAAELAGIADDIRNMPMGMDTVISEGSGGISGGQRQRLMIARAIAPKPKILMFDEATSALDNLTQKKISESLNSLKCTRIVIAHRLSTIKQCDRILVLDKGKIIEDGKYEELIAKNGFFAELVARQRLDTVPETTH